MYSAHLSRKRFSLFFAAVFTVLSFGYDDRDWALEQLKILKPNKTKSIARVSNFSKIL